MAIFPKKEPDKNLNRPAALSITSSANLPGKDIIEYITKNDAIPREIKERNWYKDYVQIALGQYTDEEARQFLKDVELKERVILARRQKTPVWTPGLEAARQKETDDLYNLGLITSVRKGTIDLGSGKKSMVEMALTSSTLVETRQGSANAAQAEPKGAMARAAKGLGLK